MQLAVKHQRDRQCTKPLRRAGCPPFFIAESPVLPPRQTGREQSPRGGGQHVVVTSLWYGKNAVGRGEQLLIMRIRRSGRNRLMFSPRSL
jgi:hypothetical protein